MAGMSNSASAPPMSDLPPQAEEEEPLDVLDLPQLYQRPNAQVLLSTLADLCYAPPSWDVTRHSEGLQVPLNEKQPLSTPKRKIRGEGIPSYLTGIISSPLTWIENDEEKEQIWEAASQRLTERSGRTAMGAISRTFAVPLHADSDTTENDLTVRDSIDNLDEVVDITLHEPALTADNLGLKTWASSFLLAKRLRKLRKSLPPISPATTILELGAGTGLVGIAAAAVLHTHVIVTDLPEIVPNLETNVRSNGASLDKHGCSVEVAVLDWSAPDSFTLASGMQQPAHSYPIIMAADPIYSSDHPALFTQTVNRHLSKSKDARVVIELPLREVYCAERQDLRERMASIGLIIVEEGEETGYDDWAAADSRDDEQLAEVRCWWSVWGWAV